MFELYQELLNAALIYIAFLLARSTNCERERIGAARMSDAEQLLQCFGSHERILVMIFITELLIE